MDKSEKVEKAKEILETSHLDTKLQREIVAIEICQLFEPTDDISVISGLTVPNEPKSSMPKQEMEAKDTVMPFIRIEEIDARNATSNFTDALLDVARSQAEISFKAGKEWILEEAEMLCPHGTLAADTSKAYKRECDFCWHILKEGII